MEKNVGLFAMDWHVRSASRSNRIRGRSDVLIVGIVRAGLRWVGLDRGIFAQIGVGYGQLRILDRFHEIGINILDLHLFLCCGVTDRFASTLFAGVCWFMGFGVAFAVGCICLAFFIELLVSLSLIFVEVLDKGLDVRNLIFACGFGLIS